MRSSPNSPNVWPGYVAAVAGLAITLLLVIAILGGDLFLVSQAVRHELQQVDGEAGPASSDTSVQIADTGSSSAAPQASSTSVREAATSASEAVMPSPRPPSTPLRSRASAPASTVGRITVVFDEDAHALDEEIRAALRTALSSLPAEQRLRLTARWPSDASSATRRAAFIRVMAVRNALLALDIAPSRIQFALTATEARSVPSTIDPVARTVVIEMAMPSTEGEPHAR